MGDAVKAVSSVNHVKGFLDKLYSLYSQSPKLQRELERIAVQLNCQLKKIGRVLNVRWAASSKLTLEAIWSSYPALCQHFESCTKDPTKKSSHALYSGLLTTLTSVHFVHSLATLLDALSEVARLSQVFQAEDTSIAAAYVTVNQTLEALQQQKEGIAGDAYLEFAKQQDNEEDFKGIALHSANTKPKLNKEQFLQALIDSMRARLGGTVGSNKATGADGMQTDVTELLEEIDVLNKLKWPSYIVSPWPSGEQKLKSLCSRLALCLEDYRKPFRDYISQPNVEPPSITDLKEAVATYPIVSADCERGFSAMNLICSDIRNALTVKHTSNLLFISLVGPPVSQFQPASFVKKWLKQHRAATDKRSKATAVKDSERYKAVWPLL